MKTQFGTPIPARTPALTPPTQPDAPTAVGTRIGQYEIIRELGRGGMGAVYAARDTRLGRRVAIKVLLDASRDISERFLVEARATALCNHENIVIIHEVGEHDGKPYMVLEYLDGHVLRELVGNQQGVCLPPGRVVELVLPIARALERAHALGIVHRDLKPENVFITAADQVKVLDFGIAKALETRDPAASTAGARPDSLHLTRAGTMVGTLPYMSPEQMGLGEVDHRTDLWSLGIMMFEMLAGRHPVQPLQTSTLIENAVSITPMPALREVAPDVPAALAKLVDHCLRKSKEERITSASALATALAALVPGRAGRALAEGESPYPGLAAFQETDADRFFGRDREIGRMVARIRELPLTAVVGPSGIGKSSFVRAGVGPVLKRSGEAWNVITMRPGRNPLAALASMIDRQDSGLAAQLRDEPGLAGARLRQRARSSGANILLFVDQFEETYTLGPQDSRAFTAALGGIADDAAGPLRVVVAMRSDFLDRVTEDQRFLDELSRGLVFLAPPGADGLREALVQPIEHVGYRFESAVMIEDMIEALDEMPGALPLLQFAAAKLWDARDVDRKLLTVASYNAIGGISGALATHANDVVGRMPAAEHRLAQRVFRMLVTPERTRAIVDLGDLHALVETEAARADLQRVIDQLVAARLLVVQTRDGGGSVEIVHESLIDRWPTLRRWLDEDQEDAAVLAQLASAAKQWESKGRPAGLLWRGEVMEEARRWYATRPRELPPRERAFLHAGLALAQRSTRLRRGALIAAFVLLGAIAIAAVTAFVWVRAAKQDATEALAKMNQEERERKAAEQQKRSAEEAKARVEREKQAAEQEVKQKAAEVQLKTAQVEESREALQEKAIKLQAALDRADTERAKAIKARDEARTAKNQLQLALEKERARVRELQREMSSLSQKLK